MAAEAVDLRDAPARGRLSPRRAVSDALVVTGRNLRRLTRDPQPLVFSTVQPVMLVLLFNFVFGGAIGRAVEAPGLEYIDFLLPGIVIQAIAFGTATTSVAMAEDVAKGLMDRFRSLPMARSAVLTGRTLADVLRIAFVVLLVTAVGLLLGYDPNTSPGEVALAFVVAVGFGLAFSWIAAWIGMTVSNAEAAQAAGFLWLFPLTFASSAFVPVETLPDGLSDFARVNPITVYVDTLRALTVGIGEPRLLACAAWFVGILLVFVPLRWPATGGRARARPSVRRPRAAGA